VARRLPSQPPALPGFNYVHVLGSGGFADVFLYEQNMPRRQVAVKVMLSEVVNDQVRIMFQAEANLMAQLSAHPSILTVYQASVSSDGRPYLVMELCSSSLSSRYRTEPVPVAEVLRIAVKIGSAVETAHRAGVLHRDIKPSNILMTAYGHPVLSDFGIASTLAESDTQEAVGMSIPWSAPEVLMDETAGSISSEVWAYAATVYSLLAGRSPFEVVGGANGSADLITRINRAKMQPIGRSDVPASLEQVLQRGMSRKPSDRPTSVLELVRQFQSIENELGIPQTAIEVAMDDWALATVTDLEERTRIRGAVVAGSSASTPSRRRRRRSASTGSSAAGAAVADSKSGKKNTGNEPHRPVRSMQVLAWVLVACAVIVIALGATATLFLLRSHSDAIPVVSDIDSTVSGQSVDFTWKDPGIASNDSYQIAPVNNGLVGTTSAQTTRTFVVDAAAGDHVCVTVTVVRAGKLGDPSGQKCVDVP
jgi:eukaryotic-like serine/threonine-protein kinase